MTSTTVSNNIRRRDTANASLHLIKNAQIVVQPHKLPICQKLAVGGMAGIVGTISTFPIDVVKTRLQSQVVNQFGVLPYSSPLQCIRSIITKEGAASLYRGLPATLVGIIPEKAIKLAANDYFREILEENGHLSLNRQMLAGAGSGLLQVIATNPLEIVKIRMQTQHNLAPAERQTAPMIIRDLGVRGLYKGIGSTISRDVPYAIVFFPLYAFMKETLADENKENSMLSVLISGGTAGAVAAAIATPADVIKTRRQIKGANYKSLMDCYRRLVKVDGYRALFRGVVPRMMVQAPLFAITLAAFELQKKYMNAHH